MILPFVGWCVNGLTCCKGAADNRDSFCRVVEAGGAIFTVLVRAELGLDVRPQRGLLARQMI